MENKALECELCYEQTAKFVQHCGRTNCTHNLCNDCVRAIVKGKYKHTCPYCRSDHFGPVFEQRNDGSKFPSSCPWCLKTLKNASPSAATKHTHHTCKKLRSIPKRRYSAPTSTSLYLCNDPSIYYNNINQLSQ